MTQPIPPWLQNQLDPYSAPKPLVDPYATIPESLRQQVQQQYGGDTPVIAPFPADAPSPDVNWRNPGAIVTPGARALLDAQRAQQAPAEQADPLPEQPTPQ